MSDPNATQTVYDGLAALHPKSDPNKAAVTESNAEFLERMKRPEDNDRPGDFERLIALAEERNIETLNATIADMEVRHAAVMLHAQTHADEYNELQSSFEDEVTKRERAEQLLLEAEDRSIQHLGAAIQEKAKRERAEAERDAALKDAERYTYLKLCIPPGEMRELLVTPWGQWDAKIDAARKEQA